MAGGTLLSQHKGTSNGHLQGRGQDAAKHVPRHRTALTPKTFHAKTATVPRLGTTVLEQLISIKKTFKMKERTSQGLCLVHCFLNPSILDIPSIVLVHELETF